MIIIYIINENNSLIIIYSNIIHIYLLLIQKLIQIKKYEATGQ